VYVDDVPLGHAEISTSDGNNSGARIAIVKQNARSFRGMRFLSTANRVKTSSDENRKQ
jgi:hypothetical protein